MANGKRTEYPRPNLAKALESRYPGVKVEYCVFCRYEDGSEGLTIRFEAESAATLVDYGLARIQMRNGKERIDGQNEFGSCGGGAIHPGRSCICHHNYDDDPPMPGNRTFPPKGVEASIRKLMKRMSAQPKMVRG